MATKSANVSAQVWPEIKKRTTRDGMTDSEFNAIMERGCNQARDGEGMSIDEAFAKIREGI